ncbi:MAG: DUF2970 domain-containing protein [Ectothiorhodospiraceae bacterium]|nr:DUF2970 domain-containing protein [Ectothiorhodospiraceae bacterium]
MQEPDDNRDRQERLPRPTLFQVIQSILAAAFGVQSQRARERDFTRGSPLPYIIGGVVFTVLLIVLLIVVVNIVLSGVG